MHIDDYPTCAETYATFRLYHVDLDPDAISRRLELKPSVVQRRGEGSGDRPAAQIGGWFLSSRSAVTSRDVRRHIDWLTAQLVPHSAVLRVLRQEGYHADVTCYWRSAQGHGGPALAPIQLRVLGELELEIGFDVYQS